MPLSSATITFDLSDHFGTDYDVRRGIRAWVDTNIDHDTVIDTDGNKIRVGSGKVTVNADGTGSFTVWVPGTGSNPASWQTYLHVEYVPTGNPKAGRTTRTFGPFTITGNADLADLAPQQEVPPTYLTTVTAQLDEKVAAAEADRVAVASDRAFVEARVVDDLGTTDGQTKALIETPASQTAQALSATIAASQSRPSWATGSRTFDPSTGGYNLNARTLAKWRKARADAQAGLAMAHVSILGDSIAMNVGAYPQATTAWPGRMKAALMRSLGLTDGGSGIVVPWSTYAIPGTPAEDPRWTFATGAGGAVEHPTGGLYTGGVTSVKSDGGQLNRIEFNAGHAYNELWVYLQGGGSKTRVITNNGSTSSYFEIESYTGAVAAGETPTSTWTMIATEAGYVRSADPATNGGLRVAKIPLSTANHTVRILSFSAATTSYVVGAEARITTGGIKVSNLAQSGRALYNLQQNNNENNGYAGWPLALDAPNADLAVLALHINDWQSHLSVANFKAQVITAVQRQRASGATGTFGFGTAADGDVLLLLNAQPNYTIAPWNGGAYQTPPLTDYYKALYEVADEQDVALLDNAWRWKDYPASSGLYRDGIHPGRNGAADIGQTIANVLTAV